jgi:quercetin dioxygenase-like cupin family protein
MRLITGLALSAALVTPGFAQTPPAPVRTIVQTFTDSAAPNLNVAIAKVDFVAGAVLPMHTHPGEESGVVASGTLKIEMPGTAPLILHAGDSYLILRGAPHQPSAPDGETHVVATFATDKDKPLATPAPVAK